MLEKSNDQDWIKRELDKKVSIPELESELSKLTEIRIVPLEKSIPDINAELKRI